MLLPAVEEDVDLPMGQRRIPRTPEVTTAMSYTQTVVSGLVHTAHMFVQRCVGRNAVSQRDLGKCFRAMHFFYSHRMARMSEAKRAAVEARSFDERVAFHCSQIRKACTLAVAVVYYLRLTDDQRMELDVAIMDKSESDCGVSVQLNKELDLYVRHIQPRTEVAWNRALKENVFAIIVAVQMKFAVIIVGAPGSTKARDV